ncbi:metallophosphoesterase [Anaeromicropila herbilytica]|uniref:Phosphoesterase n=1 Tax=Anaeromicropila herbilytica TaxID=2785025 RepID=A0A7R7EM31_9FIRM|nr:metallophosphoesterase [Anaeromicropila herbilytica]BCN31395.1 phosphoesterase [Anaeromicropila herbilytica]
MYLYILGGILFAIIVILIILFYENRKLTVTEYSIDSKKVPREFHNTKIVLLSDLHNNCYGRNNKILIARIKAINPDIILIAGDMIVGKVGYDTKVAIDLLSELTKKYSVYYGNGNHEQRLGIYEQTKNTTYKVYIEKLKKMGVHLLTNEHVAIRRGNSSITVTGLELHEDFYKKINRPTMTKEYLNQLLGRPDKNKYQVLIAHNPMYFEDYVNWGADLVVSGHVHGGMIRLPFVGGVISPQYQLFPKYDAGKFEKSGKHMILSRGLGMHTIKIRFLNKPELVVIHLKNQ